LKTRLGDVRRFFLGDNEMIAGVQSILLVQRIRQQAHLAAKSRNRIRESPIRMYRCPEEKRSNKLFRLAMMPSFMLDVVDTAICRLVILLNIYMHVSL
jgi:hypothetical protein